MKRLFLLYQSVVCAILLTALGNCSFLQRRSVKPLEFNYQKISENYFTPAHETPYPLTIQRGDNLYNSTERKGRYLFYTTDNKGNYDIWFRDLNSSVIVPVTKHPAAEYKPAISPDGSKLVFVSERYDSEGDLILLELAPAEWVEKYLSGKRFIDSDFEVLTNPHYKDSRKREKHIDTDPTWSPDGKYILFSSDRYSEPGKLDLVLYNVEKRKMEEAPITSNGGTAPYWSLDGKNIVYISYKDNPYGEIYIYNIQEKRETRVTNNQNIEYSPSLSHNSEVLFYTSIEEDGNQNGKLDGGDKGYIVRYELREKRKNYLTSNNISVFDTKYSTFLCDIGIIEQMKRDPISSRNLPLTCGSILFSASLFNTINIYFIPVDGPIPKEKNIELQFEKAQRYKSQSYGGYNLALDSIKLFFEKDPLFPIFSARTQILKVKLNESVGKQKQAQALLQTMLRQKDQKNGEVSYATALAYTLAQKRQSLQPLSDYWQSLRKTTKNPETLAAILEILGDEYKKRGQKTKSLAIYRQLVEQYPKYFDSEDAKRKLLSLEFQPGAERISEYYFTLMNDPNVGRGRLNTIQNEMAAKIEAKKSYLEKIRYLDKLIQTNDVSKKSKLMHNFLLYLKAKALYEGKKFKESLAILKQYIPYYESKPVVDPENRITLEDKKFYFEDPLYLKSLLLRALNYGGLETLVGAGQGYFNNVKFFLVNYDPSYGVEIDESVVEETFRYFENSARKLQNEYNENKEKALQDKRLNSQQRAKLIKQFMQVYLFKSAVNYFYNTENMWLIKSKNLFLESFYRENSIYYYKKMVESIFTYGKELSQAKRGRFLSQLNKNILGTSTKFISNVFDNRLTGEYTGRINDLLNVKDLQSEEVLGKQALQLAEETHFKEALPRARNYLYLASIYGYAYYLINKAITYESFYESSGSMTVDRKNKILRDLKRAEYELKWAIFADPQFSDAYQLLGWLYQYIDLSKSKLANREKYADNYRTYFPGRYIEENVDLYHQILAFLADSPNKKLLSDLNLNLANNYLFLSNYPKAKEHYENVEKYGKFIVNSSRFENYKQKAIYHYNYAKTLIYLQEYPKAVKNLNKVADLYYRNEYYTSISSNKEEKNAKGSQTTLNAAPQVTQKIVLVEALKGLAEMESRNYVAAIRSLKKALSLNRSLRYIRDANLYNALAICYQKLEEYERSEQYLSLARKDIEKNPTKEKTWFERFTDTPFKTLGDSLVSLALNKEDTIVGKSRFPKGLPDTFSLLLSDGIQIENFEEKREYSKTLDLMSTRDEFIIKKKLQENRTAKQILSLTSSRNAFNEYSQGDFASAYESYTEAYQKYKKDKKEKLYRRTFESATYAYFKIIELGKLTRAETIQGLQQKIAYLKQEKKTQVASCVAKDTSFKTAKAKEKQCGIDFIQTWKYYEPLLGMMYNYLGDAYLYSEKAGVAYQNYGMSLQYLKNPGKINEELIGLPGDIFNKKARLRLIINLARVYYKLGDKKNFQEQIFFAENYAQEYGADEELAKVKLLRANFILNKEQLNEKSLKRSLRALQQAEKNILEDYGILVETNPSFFNNLYTSLMQTSYRLGQAENLYLYKEKLDNILLFKALISDKIKFEEKKLRNSYFRIRRLVKQNNYINTEIEELTLKRKPALKLIDKRSKINGKITQSLATLVKEFPQQKHFFDLNPKKKIKEYLQNGEVAIRFLTISDTLLYWIATAKSERLEQIHFDSKEIAKIVSTVLKKEKPNLAKYQRIIFLPDKNTGQLDFRSLLKNSGMAVNKRTINFAYRNHHLEVFGKSEASHLKSYTLMDPQNNTVSKEAKDLKIIRGNQLGKAIYNTDILEGNTFTTSKNLFGESLTGYINLRELFQRQNSISLVLWENGNLSPERFHATVATIDILRAANIPAVILLPQDVSYQTRQDIRNDPAKLIPWYQKKQPPSIGTYELFKRYPRKEDLDKYSHYFRQGKQLEIRNENTKALQSYLSANAYLQKKSSRQLAVGISIARTKTKLFHKRSGDFIFFDALVEKYKKPEDKAKVLLALINYCYTESTSNICQYKAELLNQIIRLDSFSNRALKKESIASIGFYRSIRNGKLANIKRRFAIFKRFRKQKDSFSFHYDMSRLFLKNYVIPMAREHSKRALGLASSSREKYLAQQVRQKLYTIIRLLGITASPPRFKNENIYSLGLNNQWNKFDTYLGSMRDATLNSKDTYRKRILQLWKKIETGTNYNPLLLTPDKTSSGKSIFLTLDQIDTALVFNLLRRSIPLQEKDQIDRIFNLLLETQGQNGNQNNTYFMVISWAEALYHNGDHAGSLKYLRLFEENYLRYTGRKSTLKRYYLLKYKHSLINEKVSINNEELRKLGKLDKIWYPYYREIKSYPINRHIYLLNQIVRNKQNLRFNQSNREQLLDFVYYLQTIAEKVSNEEDFLDLAFARDQIATVNRKLIRGRIRFKLLPKFQAIASKLKQTIPKDQYFIAVLPYGNSIHAIKFQRQGNMTIDKLFRNRVFENINTFRNLIYNYHEVVKKEGSYVLQKELLESTFKNSIHAQKDAWKKINYIYLSSFLLKVPLEIRQSDNIYFVQNPFTLLKRKPYRLDTSFPKSFKIVRYEQKTSQAWLRILKRMEKLEVPQGGSGSATSSISSDYLYLKDNSRLLFGNKEISNLNGGRIRKAPWFLTYSGLYDTSFYSDDLNHSLYYLSNIHEGPGVFSIGEQTLFSNILFLKTMYRRSKVQIPIKTRFVEALATVKQQYPSEKYWYGYRLYTASFITEN
ncbi:MAG: hypothetical protein AAF518_04685 [Spirochaetota bacterium]